VDCSAITIARSDDKCQKEDAEVFGNVGKCIMIVGRAVYNQLMTAIQDHDTFKLGIVHLRLWEIRVLSVRLWTLSDHDSM
jgi:hypothetical protein